MTRRPALAFACAHMTDERLYAHQLAALESAYDCSVFVFRKHDSMAGMAQQVLSAMPERFTWIGLSLGGYAAFEAIRCALPRLERLVLKSEKLVGHFISNPQSPFYETEQFQQMLNRILAQPTGYRLAQKDDKLRLVIEPIRHIKDAFQKLQALQDPTN